MSFNPDWNKPALESIFSRKIKKLTYPSLILNNSNVSKKPILKNT